MECVWNSTGVGGRGSSFSKLRNLKLTFREISMALCLAAHNPDSVRVEGRLAPGGLVLVGYGRSCSVP